MGYGLSFSKEHKEPEKKLLSFESGRSLDQAAHRGCGVSLEVIQNPSGCVPVQPAQGGPALVGELDLMISKGSTQPPPFCDTVKWGKLLWPMMTTWNVYKDGDSKTFLSKLFQHSSTFSVETFVFFCVSNPLLSLFVSLSM